MPRPIKATLYRRIGTLLLLAFGFMAKPVRADNMTDLKPAAVAAMQAWLEEIDQNQYAQSWRDASASFQEAVTQEQWTDVLSTSRRPLGKCIERKLTSFLHQTGDSDATESQKRDFVVAQFNLSFENLQRVVLTVCFEKAADGIWKASGSPLPSIERVGSFRKKASYAEK